ncbi:MAG: SMI1/KNR4 family protein, partial [Flavobacterium sp.]
MRKGLDFFTPRTGSVEDSLLKVEKAIGFKLPPAYTSFLLKYAHGESGLNREMIFKNEYNRWEIAG